jgi:hypothetical protein
MAQILQSLYKTLAAGLALLIIVLLVVTSINGNPIQFSHAWGSFVFRWLHVASGVMWIGLLWYFNLMALTKPTRGTNPRICPTATIPPIPTIAFAFASMDRMGSTLSIFYFL